MRSQQKSSGFPLTSTLAMLSVRPAMIELHQFAPVWGINPSPFCLKVEIYLRLTGLAFRPVVTVPIRAER